MDNKMQHMPDYCRSPDPLEIDNGHCCCKAGFRACAGIGAQGINERAMK